MTTTSRAVCANRISMKKKMDGTVIVRATGRPLFGRAA